MTDMIRCPACRGAKKMPKLGGMIGDCNTCEGKGNILATDKPIKVEVTLEDVLSKELVNAVADCVPASDIEIQSAPFEGVFPKEQIQAAVDYVSGDVKIDGKKALYKRKRA